MSKLCFVFVLQNYYFHFISLNLILKNNLIYCFLGVCIFKKKKVKDQGDEESSVDKLETDASGNDKQASTAEEKNEDSKEGEEEDDDGDAPNTDADKPLRNQFNFSERAAQCFAPAHRDRETMTEVYHRFMPLAAYLTRYLPVFTTTISIYIYITYLLTMLLFFPCNPNRGGGVILCGHLVKAPSRATFNGNVTQWTIFDAYVTDQVRQKASKTSRRESSGQEQKVHDFCCCCCCCYHFVMIILYMNRSYSSDSRDKKNKEGSLPLVYFSRETYSFV